MIWYFLSVLTVVVGALIGLKLYFDFFLDMKDEARFKSLSDNLDRKLTEFEEIKKKVDSISLRMGFK